jgi:hypothetical protein
MLAPSNINTTAHTALRGRWVARLAASPLPVTRAISAQVNWNAVRNGYARTTGHNSAKPKAAPA